MRILINTAILRFGGAVQVALSFIHECRRFKENEYHVIVGPGPSTALDESQFPENFYFYRKNFGPTTLFKLPFIQREMAALEKTIEPDCIVTTTGPSYWRSQAPHLMGFNLGLYLYPESPYIQSLSAKKRIRLFAKKLVQCRFFRRDADAFIVQTDDVNQRVRKLFNTGYVYTVSNNHNAWYDDPPRALRRLPQRNAQPYRFLTVSNYYPHKNLELIPQVVRALPERLKGQIEFVLTITEGEFRERIATEIPEQVRLVGPVPPPECPALYRECDAMFLPTLAECFSASYPEAMKMCRPIVTTDLGFARSICGDAALYFKPGNAVSAAQQIVSLVEDESLQKQLTRLGKLRIKGFDTPSERASKVLAICYGLAGDSSSSELAAARLE